MTHKIEIDDLVSAVNCFAKSNGEELISAFEGAAALLLTWIGHLGKLSTGVADELLQAAASAVRESAALLALGAVRPSLFSQRGQIDLVLGWMYFKDHPVEYALVQRTGDGFKLKTEVLTYAKTSFPAYGEKIGLLTQIAKRKEKDTYRLLSSHIHAQSSHVVPSVSSLQDVVVSRAIADECVQIQADVAEYLSDHLFAMGISSVTSLPSKIIDSIHGRSSTAAQREILFR